MDEDRPYRYVWDNIEALLNKPGVSIDNVRNLVIDRYPIDQFGPPVGRGTVQRLRDGVAPPQLDTLTKIAGALNVPVWKLLHPSAGRTDASGSSPSVQKIVELVEPLRPEMQRFALSVVQVALMGPPLQDGQEPTEVPAPPGPTLGPPEGSSPPPADAGSAIRRAKRAT